MKKILYLLLLAPSFAMADPRFPLPRTTSEIWQNDLDLKDAISQRIEKTGITNGSDACAGCIGEYISATYTNVALVSGQYTDGTSISLTPGDWLVTHQCSFVANTTTDGTSVCGISLNGGNTSAGLTQGDNMLYQRVDGVTNASATIASYRMEISATSTVYAKTMISWTGNDPLATGRISAVRFR